MVLTCVLDNERDAADEHDQREQSDQQVDDHRNDVQAAFGRRVAADSVRRGCVLRNVVCFGL